MISWTIDRRFVTPANADVLRFLRQGNPSAHSDVAEELIRSGASLPGVHHYCPDPARYAFVVLHLEDATIVGLAFGQSTLALHLPELRVAEAVRDGGTVAPELGPTWVRFEPWANHEPLAESRRRLTRWCAVAAGGPAVEGPQRPGLAHESGE
jgi:hypothetical protein